MIFYSLQLRFALILETLKRGLTVFDEIMMAYVETSRITRRESTFHELDDRTYMGTSNFNMSKNRPRMCFFFCLFTGKRISY